MLVIHVTLSYMGERSDVSMALVVGVGLVLGLGQEAPSITLWSLRE